MPEINHKNLGTIQEHAYLEGLIISVDRTEDTASVVVLEFGARLDDVPVFYHCDPLAPIRENGAIRDGAKGFVAGDKVILLCELNTAQLNQERIKNVCVIGHMAGAKKCAYNYILVRASKNALKQIKAGETYPGEECIIYDVQEKAMAVIATGEGETLSMPCPVNNALPFLENIKFQGVSLYEEFPQGSDVVFEEAGYTPEWTEDLNGDDIRGSIEAKEWWDTYDPNGNPVMEMFEDMTFGVMNDTDGSYSKVESVLQEHEEKIAQWDENSNSFGQDFREYPIKGSVDLKAEYAINPQGFFCKPAQSKHIQTAFGENEIWVCAVNSYMGTIVSYCDEAWKFQRLAFLPSAIPIPGVMEQWDKVATKASMAQALPGGMSGGDAIGDMGHALAAETTLSGKGGENSIWSYALLKRINEGAYHKTELPAMSGSLALRTTPIPEDKQKEPAYLSAINFRLSDINIWYRKDNWANTFPLASGSYGVNVPWFFRSLAQKWRCKNIYVDTPLGSMWYQAPQWQAAVWHLYGLQLGQVLSSARQDKPLLQSFYKSAKHSNMVACQVYIVSRTGITLWSMLEDTFVKQEVYVDPYNCIPIEEVEEDVFILNMLGELKLFSEVTQLEMVAMLGVKVLYECSNTVKGATPYVKRGDKYKAVADVGIGDNEEVYYFDLEPLGEPFVKVYGNDLTPYDDVTDAVFQSLLAHRIQKEEKPVKDPVAYAKMPDNSYKHYDELTDEDKLSLLSNREFITSTSEKHSLTLSRNEIEIMASADLYADLEKNHKRRNPSDQERNPIFEQCIADLLQSISGESKEFPEIHFDMEII